MYFLLQRVKYLRAEKFTQGYLQTITEFFHQIDGYLLAVGVKHAIHAGRGHARAICQFIGTNATFFAQIAEPLGHGFLNGHKNHLKKEHRKKYAFACTHLRNFRKKGIMGKKKRRCVNKGDGEMKLIIKRGICCFVIVTLLLGIVPFAMAEITSEHESIDIINSAGGRIVDKLNSFFDEELFTEIFDNEDYTISEDYVEGKTGSIYIDLDEKKIQSVGTETYRTYTFSVDEVLFVMGVGCILTLVDEGNLISDMGVNLYLFSDEGGLTKVSQEEAGWVASEFRGIWEQ